MPVWNNRRNAIWLDVLILCEWVKSDTIRSVKTWIFPDVQDYWFAVSSLNVEAIHKDRHHLCSFVLPPQKNLPAPAHVQGAETQQACCPGQTQLVVHRWIIDFGSVFFLKAVPQSGEISSKKMVRSFKFWVFGLPSLEQNCEAQNCLGAYWIRPCPAGGEKICPSGNPYDCCPVSWHTQIVR